MLSPTSQRGSIADLGFCVIYTGFFYYDKLSYEHCQLYYPPTPVNWVKNMTNEQEILTSFLIFDNYIIILSTKARDGK